MRAPSQVSRLSVDLAEAGEMVLDHEGAVKAERFRLDVVFDEVAKSFGAVELAAAAARGGAAEQPEPHEQGLLCHCTEATRCAGVVQMRGSWRAGK